LRSKAVLQSRKTFSTAEIIMSIPFGSSPDFK
jgi:hypothetical protein